MKRSSWKTVTIAIAGIFVLAGGSQATTQIVLFDGITQKPRGNQADPGWAKPIPVEFGGWGSGIIQPEKLETGGSILRVETHGYYRGGAMTLKQPTAIEAFLNQPLAFLEMDCYFLKTEAPAVGVGMGAGGAAGMGMRGQGGMMGPGQMMGSGQGGMMGPGGMMGQGGMMGPGQMMGPGMMMGQGGMMGPGQMMGQGGMMGPGQMMGPGMMMGQGGMMGPGQMMGQGGMMGPGQMMGQGGMMGPGQMMGQGAQGQTEGGTTPTPGAPQGGAGPVGAAQAQVATSKLRVLLETEEGPLVLEDYEINPDYVINGWTKILIPLSEFANPRKINPTHLKRVVIFGDAEDEFYIGRARLVVDNDPIQAGLWPSEDFDAEVKADLVFKGWAFYGNLMAAPVSLSLDFGDGTVINLTDQKKCQGAANNFAVTHRYNKEGDFTVTLTVTDPKGVKEPVSKTVVARIRQY